MPNIPTNNANVATSGKVSATYQREYQGLRSADFLMRMACTKPINDSAKAMIENASDSPSLAAGGCELNAKNNPIAPRLASTYANAARQRPNQSMRDAGPNNNAMTIKPNSLRGAATTFCIAFP